MILPDRMIILNSRPIILVAPVDQDDHPSALGTGLQNDVNFNLQFHNPNNKICHETAKNLSYGGIVEAKNGIFYEDSDFEVELGPRWPKMTINGSNFAPKCRADVGVGADG